MSDLDDDIDELIEDLDELDGLSGPTSEDVDRARSGAPVRRLAGFGEVVGTAMIGLGKALEPEKYERMHIEAQAPEEDSDADDGELLRRISFGGGLAPLW